MNNTWKTKSLGELAEIRSGGTPSTKDQAAWNGDIPWCTPTDITSLNGEKYISKTQKYITQHGLKTSAAELIPPNSVVMTSRATIGECAINTATLTTNQGFKTLTPNESTDPEFLYYLLLAQKNTLTNLSAGSTFLEITKRQLEKHKVKIPPTKTEQELISKKLIDIDHLIRALTVLIDKKRAIKQASMQQIFSEKIRPPKHKDRWKIRRLGDLASMSSGGTPSSGNPEYYDGDIPWVSISDMTKGGKFISKTDRNLTALGLQNSSAKIFPKNTVLYSMYASLGECSIANIPTSTSQAILGIQTGNNLIPSFLYHYLHYIKPTIASLGQQGTQSNLNKSMVQNFLIPTPPSEEQEEISKIIDDIDNEIEALDSLKRKNSDLKKSMMQGLLTGQIRLNK